MGKLEISLLGPLQVHLDARPVTRFRADSDRALLAYLALNAHTPIRRETLAGLLWPDHPEVVSRQNLRQALSQLRKAIGDRETIPSFLQITRKTIQLNPEGHISLDATAFADLLSACAGHRHRRIEACQPCVQRLEQAVGLYRGDLVAGFSLPSAPFEEWLVTEREHLHHQALDALHHLAVYHERRDEHDRVRHFAQRQLEMEPWREVAHRQLMRALALSDQRGAALAQYERCRHTLMEELGAEPEEETTRLYAHIQSARDGSDLRSLSLTPPHNLPAAVTPFVGRESELTEIEGRLQDPGCRLLTMVGPGGSGKTRLALEAASRQRHSFEHGVFFVSLAALRSVEGIVPAIAQAVGLSLERRSPAYAASGGHPRDPRQPLLDYLRGRSMLLILDNYEHLLAGADVTTGILKSAPDVRILVTSRAALNVGGEHLLTVGGMEHPKRGAPEAVDARRYSAVQLFLCGAERVRPGVEWRREELGHVAEVCRLVEGMPLAILLAAAWVKVMTPAEIAGELSTELCAESGGGLDFLEGDERDIPERQRGMRTVFGWSWNLLSEREREIMKGLSVFRGGCTQEAAHRVTGASLRDLRGLVDQSFLQRTPAGRCEVHELLRQYAAERLHQAADGGKAARDRHAACYVAALGPWARDLKGPRQQSALAEIGADLDNARVAWAWAARQGWAQELARGADALGLFYEWQNRFEEGSALFGLAGEALSGAASADELRALIKVLAWKAHLTLRGERADALRQK